eukprot:gene10382-biopygen1355
MTALYCDSHARCLHDERVPPLPIVLACPWPTIIYNPVYHKEPRLSHHPRLSLPPEALAAKLAAKLPVAAKLAAKLPVAAQLAAKLAAKMPVAAKLPGGGKVWRQSLAAWGQSWDREPPATILSRT